MIYLKLTEIMKGTISGMYTISKYFECAVSYGYGYRYGQL